MRPCRLFAGDGGNTLTLPSPRNAGTEFNPTYSGLASHCTQVGRSFSLAPSHRPQDTRRRGTRFLSLSRCPRGHAPSLYLLLLSVVAARLCNSSQWWRRGAVSLSCTIISVTLTALVLVTRSKTNMAARFVRSCAAASSCSPSAFGSLRVARYSSRYVQAREIRISRCSIRDFLTLYRRPSQSGADSSSRFREITI